MRTTFSLVAALLFAFTLSTIAKAESQQVGEMMLDDGQGVEFFYNIEVRPWLHVTPDYQIIDSGLKTNDTAHVFGLRVKIDL